MTTTPQRGIGSGFHARSTTDDVLRGIDLTGTLAIVTGGYSGLGRETTRAVAERALTGVDGVEVDELDLADLASVRAFAERVLASGRTVDVLVNNAAVMACPETRVGPGWEAQFATNHLGHFALVNHLWPALAAGGGGRVVSVSSAGHHLSDIRWDDPHFSHGYDRWLAYGQAKTANVLLAVHLDARGRDAGVRAFALHPGAILTPLQRHMTRQEMLDRGWIDEAGTPAESFKTPEQGAATQVWAATSPLLAGLGGVYCEDCDIAEVCGDDDASMSGGVRGYAVDPRQAARLWALSAELTGVDAFAPSTS
ncbi:SDR family NAD(P)-dependent oxidoreductase [Streptomyces buecherae]|uniref:SDR family NAD(P)-dependent oxidoreductase n=1 Tax=Streptomyces buecherae TaxID=2763006 RepID=UPI003655F9DE